MLTKRQKDTLAFIEGYIETHGESPLVSEIAEGLGLKSLGSTHRYIQALIDQNFIKTHYGRTRSIELVHKPLEPGSLTLPYQGKIAAGRLVEAVPDESEIDVGEMFQGKGRYVLKIAGDSMTGKGIMPGDYVVVDATREPKDGDMIVALVDGTDATLKTLTLNKDKTVSLVPANPDYETVTLEAHRLNIQGVVVGQMRTYP